MDNISFFPPLFDDLFPSIPDEDFKEYHSIDRELYEKLINTLGRDPSESMQIMAFYLWLEVVGGNLSYVKTISGLPLQLLNGVTDEAKTCLKVVEEDMFEDGSYHELFLIPKLLNNKFSLEYFHKNRVSTICGVRKYLERVCIKAFDDIVQNPMYFTSGNSVSQDAFEYSMLSENTLEEIGSSMGKMVQINPSYVPSGGGILLGESMNSENKIEEIGSSSRVLPPIDASHVPGGGPFLESMVKENFDEIGRAARMRALLNHSYVPTGGIFLESMNSENNINEELGMANRMVPMMSPITHAQGGAGIYYGSPYYVPNQYPYMSPFLGGSMNLAPYVPPIYGHFPHVNASNIGSGIHVPSEMVPPPSYEDLVAAEQTMQVVHSNIAELFRKNLNISAEEAENEVPPDDRTVFLTFSKGYPITESEVKEFFTRKFGEDVEAIYMQEVPDDEQALYARLVTRSPAALEAIVDGGKAKYNINGKHVWARKYVKKPKQLELLNSEGQTSSPVASTSDLA